jgi:ABC-type multidrug transport system fused ATPase/permease subunit
MRAKIKQVAGMVWEKYKNSRFHQKVVQNPKVVRVISVGIPFGILAGIFFGIAAIFMLLWNAFPAAVVTVISTIGLWQACIGLGAIVAFILTLTTIKTCINMLFAVVSRYMMLQTMKKATGDFTNIMKHLGMEGDDETPA